MEQEEQMDFKALRAKFQQEEFILKKPKIKPVLPEKPKVVSPPQSPTHHLPSGARPSLLTTINENLEQKTLFAPRVVFKDDQKESKKPLINTKDKSEGKPKGVKYKPFKGSRENVLEDQKKANNKEKTLSLVLPVTKKESTAELVPDAPPPKVTKEKKKGFSLFKSTKRDSALISADPILDTPSLDIAGPAPLIPVPSELGNETLLNATPEPHLPDSPTLPDHSSDVEISPPSTTVESFVFNPPPPLIPESPPPEIPSLNSETPPEVENPAFPVSSQDEIIPSPLSVSQPIPSSGATSGPHSLVSTPSPSPPKPEITTEIGKDAIYIPAVEKPPSVSPSPKPEHPISALSALERAEDMSAGKRTSPGDSRILKALQKARKKTSSPLTSDIQSYSLTPPPEETSQCQSPTESLPELPPIDYEDRTGNGHPSKPAQVNGIDHLPAGQSSPLLKEITEGPGAVPELLVVPPPPPKMTISDNGPLNSSVEELAIPYSTNLSEFIPPPLEEINDIPAPHEFSESYTLELPEVGNVASDVHVPVLQGSELEYEMYPGPDVTDGHDLPKVHSNGITLPHTEIHTEAPYGGISQTNLQAESSNTPNSDLQQASEPQTEDDVHHNTDNVYEYIATPDGDKKKVKIKGKKRKGEPKNPYVEPAPVMVQEKNKTARFGKGEKKAAAEGPDEKELKKKEKQRLEKEKKELKEKQEREKKEQKEREKRENEMKKKFKITGTEDALYQARVVVTTKGRKTDLPVKEGDTVSIIRTANCPKGKWLARDSSNSYGYVAVDHVELDIKEMLQLGRKTLPRSNNNFIEPDGTRMISHDANHYQGESFEDDSEEWTGDDEPLSGPDTPSAQALPGHSRTFSMPDMGNNDLNINHQHSHSDMGHDTSHNQALQKLATFFRPQKSAEPAVSTNEPAMSHPLVLEEPPHVPSEPQTSYTAGSVNVAQEANHTPKDMSIKVADFVPDTLILPPPVMYADGVE